MCVFCVITAAPVSRGRGRGREAAAGGGVGLDGEIVCVNSVVSQRSPWNGALRADRDGMYWYRRCQLARSARAALTESPRGPPVQLTGNHNNGMDDADRDDDLGRRENPFFIRI